MTLAAVLDEYYGPLVGIPLYGLAGMVGLERMDDREHHFSDVVFGAVLDTSWAKRWFEITSPCCWVARSRPT